MPRYLKKCFFEKKLVDAADVVGPIIDHTALLLKLLRESYTPQEKDHALSLLNDATWYRYLSINDQNQNFPKECLSYEIETWVRDFKLEHLHLISTALKLNFVSKKAKKKRFY